MQTLESIRQARQLVGALRQEIVFSTNLTDTLARVPAEEREAVGALLRQAREARREREGAELSSG